MVRFLFGTKGKILYLKHKIFREQNVFKLAGEEFGRNFLLGRVATFIGNKVDANLGFIMKSLKSREMIIKISSVVNQVFDPRKIKRIEGIEMKE